uniref:Uncharacterized protein n=1 Tax=Timema cristinae TaxID=61476 RepID=A0A7R9CT73_TIMCR|nr:unnamed protein product [Timema cristinae]
MYACLARSSSRALRGYAPSAPTPMGVLAEPAESGEVGTWHLAVCLERYLVGHTRSVSTLFVFELLLANDISQIFELWLASDISQIFELWLASDISQIFELWLASDMSQCHCWVMIGLTAVILVVKHSSCQKERNHFNLEVDCLGILFVCGLGTG